MVNLAGSIGLRLLYGRTPLVQWLVASRALCSYSSGPHPRAKPLNPLPTPTGGHKKLESQQRVANKVMQLPKPSGKVGSWKWTMGMGMGDGVMAMFHAPCSMLHVPPIQEYGHPKYD